MITNLETVRRLAINWGQARPKRIEVCPPEARVVTGKPGPDALFYYFETESGLLINLSDDYNVITGYEVIDKEKFIMFLLRWS